jgi:hypothetical protein
MQIEQKGAEAAEKRQEEFSTEGNEGNEGMKRGKVNLSRGRESPDERRRTIDFTRHGSVVAHDFDVGL